MTDPPSSVDVTLPDIGAYRRGNTGIDYVTSFVSGRPGPHVVINGLIHGNEPCGAIAIDALFRMGVRPTRGALTLVLANVAAYRGFDSRQPYASRFVDEDMNRLWSDDALGAPRTSAELRRARSLRPVYATADRLLDLHSMTNDSPPLILCGATGRARRLARSVGYPAWIVADDGHAAGRRLLDHAGFADPAGERTALLAECGQHWRQETAAVALETALRFLLAVDVIDRDWTAPHLPDRDGATHEVEVTHVVTVASDNFVFADAYVGLERVPRAGTTIALDGGTPVRTPYDDCVLIMPTRRARPGQTAVRLGRIVP